MNPIMQLLNRSSKQPQQPRQTGINSQFVQFLKENEGKSPEQIAREHGLDFKYVNDLWQMLKTK